MSSPAASHNRPHKERIATVGVFLANGFGIGAWAVEVPRIKESLALSDASLGLALFAFALGFACCLPTALLMLYNGFSLGAFVMVFASHGLLLDFLGWTLVHGVTELFAVILAGAAGFHIGWSIAFPRHLSRLDAAAAAGRTAATVMAGVVLMLAMAGMLEGFGRQLIQSTAARYGVATVTAIGWGLYFYRPGRGR